MGSFRGKNTRNRVQITRKLWCSMDIATNNYRNVIQKALLKEFGNLRGGAKMLARLIGISHRSVENWFSGECSPNGTQLIELMASNNAIAEEIMDLVEKRRCERQEDHHAVDKVLLKPVQPPSHPGATSCPDTGVAWVLMVAKSGGNASETE